VARPEAAGIEGEGFYAEAARLAAQVGPTAGSARHATIHLVRSGAVTRIATSTGDGAERPGPDAVADHPRVTQAVDGDAIVIDRSPRRTPRSRTAAGSASVAAIPVHSDGVVVGVLEVEGGSDDFDARHLEQLVTLANLIGAGLRHDATVSDLTEEAERSRSLEKMKSEFLNIAAHELRSPLGIIRGYASLLSEVALSAEEREVALERIGEKSEEMARLISDMLETARLETMGLDLSLTPIDLEEVISDAVDAMRPLLGADHSVDIQATGTPIAVVADRRRLTTMLTNLLDNAIKYSPRGGAIEIRVTCDGRVAEVLVQDHGIGISAEQVPFLFTRFGRLVTPETSHIRGTGLGLYLARETARLHGGDIVVTSQAAEGSTFTITLPVA
jgi:signal transduction histidine kinase